MMNSDKPNPPIDLSHAKEPPRSFNPDELPDTGSIHEDETFEEEVSGNTAEDQVNTTNTSGLNIFSAD